MNPKYTILLCNQNLDEFRNKIALWLKEGIKVLWFGNSSDVVLLKEEYENFAKALLLQAYSVEFNDKGIIVDGVGDEVLFEKISQKCPLFNSAQFLVEHCKKSEHIIVQASAGTGKTTVMIDRILYLLHTVPDLKMSEIYMMTFTNDAANQMNQRLQEALLCRYKLTKQKKYLKWLEEQSQMSISTIHSFAYSMLKELGIGESFTRNLSIKSFQFEKEELIKDLIDEEIDENSAVKTQLGLPFYRANTTIRDFWKEFSKLGISHEDISKMNWGKPEDKKSTALQNLLSSKIETLDNRFWDIKRENEAVSIDDVMRDLQHILVSGYIPKSNISMKYLFIDEYQDSDLSQMNVACLLVQHFNAILFVVGDVKQSIYRFRGANDKAFISLRNTMKEMNIPRAKEFTLVNNYRTSSYVLQSMENYFKVWGKLGRLQYDKDVVPFNTSEGSIKMIPGMKKEEAEDQIANITSKALEELVSKVEKNNTKVTEKTRVVLLARTNRQLTNLGSILRKNKIPASVRTEGSFYASEAVRDFYIMVSSYVFCDEPKYIFNFLLTPYAGEITPMNVNDMEFLNGDYNNLITYLDKFLNQTVWKKYHKMLRLRPVLSVFKEMLDEIKVIDNFILNSKIRKKNEGWEEKRCLASTYTESRQYQANLEKLLDVLQRNFGGDKVSLYDIYNFLKLNIASNRSESEAEVEALDDYRSVLCMTVHKSKGLEFDTVIIPYTNRAFPSYEDTELLIDPENKKVGWNYIVEDSADGKTNDPMRNEFYVSLKQKDMEATKNEETRILYVAMTRAINNLICIVPEANNDRTWAYLFEEGGVDNE